MGLTIMRAEARGWAFVRTLRGLALALAAGSMLGAAPAARAQEKPPVPSAAPARAGTPATVNLGSAATGDPRGDAAAPAEPNPATVPIPEARPEPAPADTAPTGSETPAPQAPVPEIRPNAPPSEKAKPAEPGEKTQTPAESAKPAPGADKPADPGKEAPAAEPQPQPAYVPPDRARTEPEPGAPAVPEMAVTPAQTVEAAAAVEDAVACEKELKARGAEFTVGETIAEGECGVLRPVSLTKLSSGVKVSPGTTFLCRTALALDIWVSEGVVPAAKEEFDGAKVTALGHASTYSCRARASESRISEHSRGSAIDIATFELGNGKSVPVEATEPGTAEDRFAAKIRRAACGPFRTVLGPGTDNDHGTHLHLDIAARSHDSTYCR
ncbi:extensin family protein [Aureimonas sp. D3]|uniref:extensin family protein n=1 Tax=Aureimonas sp. D3 TaxID=1638164 RepID=UPI000780E011|nr:extensin family protein [Aureimonas sp. D3]